MTTKTEPTAADVAKLRKGGAKWDQVREKTGLKWTDTKFRDLLRAAGYAPSGIKGGAGLEVQRRDGKKGKQSKRTVEGAGQQKGQPPHGAKAARSRRNGTKREEG